MKCVRIFSLMENQSVFSTKSLKKPDRSFFTRLFCPDGLQIGISGCIFYENTLITGAQ